MAGAVLVGDRLPRDDALAGDELEHLVEEQHRVAVRQDRLDLGLVQNDVVMPESLSRRPLRPRCA